MSDNLTKARIAKLKIKADSLGITYPEDVTEDIIKEMIAQYTPKPKEQPSQAALDAKTMGEIFGREVGRAIRETKSAEPYETVRDEDIDPEDIVAERTFYVPMLFWIAPAKKIAGQRVMAPIEKVLFQLDRGSSVQVGTQFQTRYTATYKTNNRKQIAWLESHPLYKRVFFPSNSDTSDMSSRDVRFAMSFGRHMDALNYTMPAELYRLASELGVELNHTDSLAVHRSAIANAQAQQDIMRQDAQENAIRSEASRLNLLQQMQ